MKPIILYFSRSGNTKRFAQAIAEISKAPIFDNANAEASIIENYDLVIIGSPVEGAGPAKEVSSFLERMPKTEGKKAIVFVTYRIFVNGRTINAMKEKLSFRGYAVVLDVSKKIRDVKPGEFAEPVAEIQKTLEILSNAQRIPCLFGK